MIFDIKDMNGKNFSVDTDKISKINGDLADSATSNLQDAKRNRVHIVHDVKYFDVNGNVVDSQQLLNDMKAGKAIVSAIDVTTEATHSGKNHNYCVYYEDSMEKDAESFVNPFNKPMLKNHNNYSGEPIGRIRQAWHGPSALTDERSAIHITSRVTDKDAIEKFIDGRYGTVSIGGSMGTVTCNICGKTILKDGKFNFCGHYKGETYKDQVCYWGVRDIEYNELSVVNCPADDYAQVMKITVLTDADIQKGNNKEGENDSMDGQGTKQTDAKNDAKVALRDNLVSMIDQLLDSQTEPTQTQSKEPETTTQQDGTQQQPEAQDGEQPPVEKTIEDYKAENEELNNKISDMQAQLDTALADTEEIKKNLEAKDAEYAALKEEADAKIEEAKTFKDQFIALATEYKTEIVDSILLKENVEDAEARRKELLAMSVKELQSTKDALNAQPRQMAHVDNPTVPNKEAGVTDSTDGNPASEEVKDENKKATIQDYTDDIVDTLFGLH